MESIPLDAMRLVFRSDASLEKGTGHVMRSSAIAEEAICRGLECFFVGNLGGISWLETRIKELGFSGLYMDHSDLIWPYKTDVLILDSYSISLTDPFIQPEKWAGVVTIADKFTPAYECDLIVHPGFDVEWLASVNVPILAGAEYILTRKSIEKVVPAVVDPVIGPRVLVVGGGSDPFGFCKAIASVLDTLAEPFEADFLSNEKIVSGSGKIFRTHSVGGLLDELVKGSQVVLTTASTTSLEFIAREIPTGIACVASNQENYFREMVDMGVAEPIGIRTDELGWALDVSAIRELINSNVLRQSLHADSRNLIDLRGAERVVDFVVDHFTSARFNKKD